MTPSDRSSLSIFFGCLLLVAVSLAIAIRESETRWRADFYKRELDADDRLIKTLLERCR